MKTSQTLRLAPGYTDQYDTNSEYFDSEYDMFKADVEHLLEFGESLEYICRVLGVTPATAARRFYRRGDVKLGRKFETLVPRKWPPKWVFAQDPENFVEVVRSDLAKYTPQQTAKRHRRSLTQMRYLFREHDDIRRKFDAAYRKELHARSKR